MGVGVTSEDDENPDLRFRSYDHYGILRTEYGSDAPPSVVAHVFSANLACFWGFRRCKGPSDVAPLLWRDKIENDAATLARLKSGNPCPERIITGRMKHLIDLDVSVLESEGSRHITVNIEGRDGDEVLTNFRIFETLEGEPKVNLSDCKSSDTISYPGDYERQMPNPGPRWFASGQKVLLFSNANFSCCALMMATPSAIAIVRNTHPPARHREDAEVRSL